MPAAKPLTPEEFVSRLGNVLPRCVHTEQDRLLRQARAWATVYHDGDVPQSLDFSLRILETHYGID
jgi:hypothetical protein